MKYVIIGNSAAGVSAVEGIRSADAAGEIVVISEERFPVYGRPLISYYLLGATDRSRMNYRPEDFYEKMGVRLMPGERAERIDVSAKEVVLKSGVRVGYDKLLVATGSRPFDPPMEGLGEVKQKFHFMSMQDALDLEKALSVRKRALIVGAGLIGLKCLEGILGRVKSVTVVDMAGHILPSILDDAGAAIVQRELEAKGVRFCLSDSVKKFEAGTAHLAGGGSIPFDLLVVAVGVRPNVELVREAGGDSAFGSAIPLNAIGFFGSHVLTAGSYTGESYTEAEGERYRRFFVQDGVLKGFILVNAPERAGIYTSLVRNRTPLAGLDTARLEAAPVLAAFPASVREAMLSREV